MGPRARPRRVARVFLVLIAVGAVAAFALLRGSDGASENSPGSPPSGSGASSESPPEIVPYRPIPAEEYPNGKRIAARIALRALTYDENATPATVARSLGRSAVGPRAIARAVEPAVQPGARSSAEVVYPQLSGLTATSLGAMVVVRQELESDSGNSTVTRVLDIRLRRSGGPWSLDQIGSVGGSETPEPASLSASAREVLDNPGIELPDSARWDIYGGEVDSTLLGVLAEAGRKRGLSVTVLDSGHPPNVWETTRPSAHSTGLAVDIWAVDGVPVIEQRKTGSPAYELAASFAAGGAAQLGSPWGLGATGFTDDVHQDHIHLQQTSTGTL